MISRIDLRGSAGDPRELLPRADTDVSAAMDKVRPVCEDVRLRGTEALVELTERFDGVRLSGVRVPRAELDSALAGLDPGVRAALEESIERTRRVHADQRRADTTTRVVPGGTVTERWIPVNRVGLYVPGGRAVYPSSVVMNVVPAQEAGVGSLGVTSPPRAEFGGLPHPAVLAACALLGVDEVYAVGGAQAVAMFAYGAGECERADMVTGPGNIWVAAAKRLLKGVVGIDAEAGPTEIAVLADDTADPAFVAADLVSQAEHDVVAASVLITPSEELAGKVETELASRVAATRHSDRVAEALGGPQSGIVLVDDIAHGLAVVDAYAAEHLEVMTADSARHAAAVRNAGAVFVGRYSPVSLGDYLAGSNHVLPTGGSAVHTAGLSVQTFLRGVHVVEYGRDALAASAEHVQALAEAEDLPAHGEAVAVRVGTGREGEQ
ncbi:histidinol dehydrogenase [Streptomonospora wellingtoniae]|uniref:Histidinol dehydrogenase n=1 Tax=Streptomonospora wellingtoniae TaxID=3075544 RepID=A0ABU2KPH8_9ACTN|nr:histidinol dehydrogenase [Streptomonospora sp. DSM 45055]MDT0301185.1 histidinol dehydrogenase [Streptomonospora sp. DSM 45055]